MLAQTGLKQTSPDDFVAGATNRGPPAAFGWLLRRLQDGAAVLHGRGLDTLLVLGHHSAAFIRAIAVGKVGVGDPRWSAGWTRTARRCCCLGAWKQKEQHVQMSARQTLVSRCHSCACADTEELKSVSSTSKQMLLGLVLRISRSRNSPSG